MNNHLHTGRWKNVTWLFRFSKKSAIICLVVFTLIILFPVYRLHSGKFVSAPAYSYHSLTNVKFKTNNRILHHLAQNSYSSPSENSFKPQSHAGFTPYKNLLYPDVHKKTSDESAYIHKTISLETHYDHKDTSMENSTHQQTLQRSPPRIPKRTPEQNINHQKSKHEKLNLDKSETSRRLTTSAEGPAPAYQRATLIKECSKQLNVAFLKVHKCGSSTVVNILQRFALEHNSNVVLPLKPKRVNGYNYLGYGRLFNRSMVIPLPRGETFNLLFNHVVYNRSIFHELLPQNTFYFAIVRETVSKFKSAMWYFNLEKRIVRNVYAKHRQLGKNQRRFLSPQNLTSSVLSAFLRDESLLRSYDVIPHVSNSIAYDFGIPPSSSTKLSLLHHIKQLENDFNFVMIMEYFDESLILLKRFLCWDHKDILYIKKNSFKTLKSQLNITFGTILSLDLTSEDVKNLKSWQMADSLIYEHFNRSFWKHVSSASPDFFEEVAQFRHILAAVTPFCESGKSRTLLIEASRWNKEFSLSEGDCELILSTELSLQDRLIDKAITHVENRSL